MATGTALLFDHKNETARFVSYDGELETLYGLIDVDMIDTIRLDSRHIVFVDDEGLLKQYETGFRILYKGASIIFSGSGLLTGDLYGENAPISLNISDLQIEVLKFNYEEKTSQEEGV